MIKVDIISGFLGAGKTTLIKHLFQGAFANEQVVLIENEFGEIGIDGSFLKESGVQIKEINSGCICCSLVGDFASSIKELIDTYHPDRIIIEPSGVGKLSDIVTAVSNVKEDLKINIVCTVVDGSKAKSYMKNFGEFFINQVEAANTIVVSKTDKTSEEKLAETMELLKEKNPNATYITTRIDEIDSTKLLSVLESHISLKEELIETMHLVHEHECDDEECECHHHHDHDEDEEEHEHHHHHDENEECECHHHHHDHDEEDEEHEHHHHHDEDEECDDPNCECHHHHHDHDEDEEGHEHHHHHHHADEVFHSWGLETPSKITKDGLDKFLSTLASTEEYGIILRSKGILQSKDTQDWYYFDYVSGDYEIRTGEPDVTGRIVVIGSKLQEEKIEKLFKECL